MRISHVLASTAVGAALLLGGAVAAPAQAATAPADSRSASAVPATWQWTGEYFSTESACKARKSYYMAASNVYDYKCVPSGGLWGGKVLAD
ncbi:MULTISPECIES: hypothetical protein [unclassified Streptomyces]|uniref:hypothetical protein n=1 Tax=unclassified Streptomyces TaxID=2593676 RepID=UPI0011E6868C|nr:hypothetical protein [Streptomyces sp. sk2.1]TXS67900.1 hypothetical protein EAO76_34695 [Streptomyces sp. sk2.1]